MNTKLTAVLTCAVAVSAWMQSTQAEEAAATPPAPVEAFYCNYQDGKDMGDLMKVAGRFSDWADDNFTDYSAWLLTPSFGQLEELPDVIWLGSNTSGDSMGKGQDAYRAGGADVQKEFDKVVDCGAHVLASSIQVHAPDGPPGDGVVMFSQCSIAEGSDWSKAVTAQKRYAAAMRAIGAKNSNWMFFPMLGGPSDANFDYWGVATFNNWTEYFAAYELYVNGGGWQASMESMGGAATCAQGTASVWDVKVVHQADLK